MRAEKRLWVSLADAQTTESFSFSVWLSKYLHNLSENNRGMNPRILIVFGYSLQLGNSLGIYLGSMKSGCLSHQSLDKVRKEAGFLISELYLSSGSWQPQDPRWYLNIGFSEFNLTKYSGVSNLQDRGSYSNKKMKLCVKTGIYEGTHICPIYPCSLTHTHAHT